MIKTDKRENNGAGSVFCRRCKEFLHEDESGYGFCARDGEERHCSDLCKWQDVSEYRKMPRNCGILREKEATA